MGTQTCRKLQAKYIAAEDVFAFYIENGNYVAEVPRKYPNACSLLKERLTSCSIGKQVSSAAKNGFKVLRGSEICGILAKASNCS